MTNWKKKRIAQAEQHRGFAIAALAGIAGHMTGPERKSSETNAQAHARWAFGVADAMMEVRNVAQ